jgi:hypothetical protein
MSIPAVSVIFPMEFRICKQALKFSYLDRLQIGQGLASAPAEPGEHHLLQLQAADKMAQWQDRLPEEVLASHLSIQASRACHRPPMVLPPVHSR